MSGDKGYCALAHGCIVNARATANCLKVDLHRMICPCFGLNQMTCDNKAAREFIGVQLHFAVGISEIRCRIRERLKVRKLVIRRRREADNKEAAHNHRSSRSSLLVSSRLFKREAKEFFYSLEVHHSLTIRAAAQWDANGWRLRHLGGGCGKGCCGIWGGGKGGKSTHHSHQINMPTIVLFSFRTIAAFSPHSSAVMCGFFRLSWIVGR